MQVTSTYRYARISAFKAQGGDARNPGSFGRGCAGSVDVQSEEGGGLVKKTLKSAIANAENNAELKVDTLLVKEAIVGEGPTFKRFRPRARGSASPIRKRTSHIRIVLSDEGGTRANQNCGQNNGICQRLRGRNAPRLKGRKAAEKPPTDAEAETEK